MQRASSVLIMTIMACIAGMLGAPAKTSAQVGPGGLINPIRDCQTIRTCRYDKRGSYRGCLSSYSCRTCSFVRARCEIGGRRQNCQEMRCSWGG